MTKQELLQDAANKFKAVGSYEAVDTDTAGVTCYDLQVFEVKNDGTNATRRTVQFYVINDGQAEEAAYWRNSQEDTSWQATVKSMIDSFISSGEILKGAITEIDEENQFAIVRTFKNESEIAVEKQYFVYNNGTENKYLPM